jgi:cysteine sulfinate desulfinase/cysteine desulfurase-like protein
VGIGAAVTAMAALETARGQVTALFGCQNDDVIFVNGGSFLPPLIYGSVGKRRSASANCHVSNETLQSKAYGMS